MPTTTHPSRMQVTADITSALVAWLSSDPDTFRVLEQLGAKPGRHGERGDVGRVCWNGLFDVYEVKSCGADVAADASKRHVDEPWRAMGNRRWYVCLRGVIDRPPNDYGLIYCHGGDDLRIIIEPVINDRPSAISERAMKGAVMKAWMAEDRAGRGDSLPAHSPNPIAPGRGRTPMRSNLDRLAELLAEAGGSVKLGTARRKLGIDGQDSLRRAIEKDSRFEYEPAFGSVRLAVAP